MHIHTTLQTQLRLGNGNLTLTIVANDPPIQIGFHFLQNQSDPGTCYHAPLNPNPEYLQKSIQTALADPRVNEDPEVAPAVLAAAQELLKRGKTTKPIDPVLDRMLEMNAEHESWLTLAREFNLLQDINAPGSNALVLAIRLWGERLALLRRKGTAEECSKALKDAKAAYNL